MIQVSNSNLSKNLRYAPSFCARKFVVQEVSSYVEKLKINKKIENAISREFYEHCQTEFPKFFRYISEKMEKFLNLLTTPFLEIKKYDIVGIYDENKNLLGGFMGKKIMRQYCICGLYIDRKIQRTKDAPKALIMMMNKIKELAQNKHLSIISCDVYRNAHSTRRLYKKVGFEEVNTKGLFDSLITIDLIVPTKKLGQNIDVKKFGQ